LCVMGVVLYCVLCMVDELCVEWVSDMSDAPCMVYVLCVVCGCRSCFSCVMWRVRDTLYVVIYMCRCMVCVVCCHLYAHCVMCVIYVCTLREVYGTCDMVYMWHLVYVWRVVIGVYVGYGVYIVCVVCVVYIVYCVLRMCDVL